MIAKLLSLCDGTPHELSGGYLVEYDPTVATEDGGYDGGLLRVTHDRGEAREFPNIEELFRYLGQSHGLRPDGKPNRPITAFNVEVMY